MSIMSSLRMQILSVTSPMSAMISAWLCFQAVLVHDSDVAIEARVENFFAAFARPVRRDHAQALGIETLV